MSYGTTSKIMSLGASLTLALATVVIGIGPAAAGTDPLPPPANLRVTDLDHTSATVEWDPSPGATHYTVIWSPPVNWLDTEDTSITFPVEWPGARYHVSVRAYDDDGSSLASSLTFTAPKAPPPPVPPMPENFQAAASPGSLTVEWDPSFVDGVEAEAYVVRLSPTHTGIVTSDTTLTHNVPPGHEYSVTVTARNGFFSESERSEPLEVTVPPAEDWEPLTAPSNLRAAPVTYHLHLDGTEIESTRDLHLNSPYFAECTGPGQTPATFVVTATSHGVASPPSNSIILCL